MNTTYKAEVIADSINPNGNRITTMVVTYPRIILAELNTHRMFSRNSASSRAIPTEKLLEQVALHPYEPAYLGKNRKGMQATEQIDESNRRACIDEWILAADRARKSAQYILSNGAHKQTVNRLLEPWMWMTTLITATEWDNFFALRCHKDAQPEFQVLAYKMLEAYVQSKPVEKKEGDWHIPFQMEVFEEEKVDISNIIKVSVGRCARVSYLNHDGKININDDLALYNKLYEAGHMSPFEHIAKVPSLDVTHQWYGNFKGWIQLRKTLPNESRSYNHQELLDNIPEWIKNIT